MTHICVGKPAIIGSDNGLSPDRRQAIIWTNAGILLIGPLGTYFSEILTGIQTFSFKKMHLKMSSAKWCSFCLGLNVLSENGFKPDGTNYLNNVELLSMVSCRILLKAITHEVILNVIRDMRPEILLLKLPLHLPWGQWITLYM